MTTANSAIMTLPIALVEDIRLLRDGIASMLRAEGLRVVAAIRSGEDAVRQILSAQPRLVLLDAALGNHEGPKLVHAVTEAAPGMKVVVMDMRPAQDDVIDFIRVGVRGFILKDATAAEIIATLRAVANGLAVLPPRLAGVLFSYVAAQETPARRGDGGERLTLREREIAELIAVGSTNKEIASRLNIAVHTVKSHVHSVLEKLTLSSRLQIANFVHMSAAVSGARPPELVQKS